MRSTLNRLLRFILYFLTSWPSAICGRHLRSFAFPMFDMRIGSSVFVNEFVTLFPHQILILALAFPYLRVVQFMQMMEKCRLEQIVRLTVM